ncbi:MAG: toprim domain-containing protein [Eubacteriales bacterium]|jgi:ribonuclease M5
MIEVKQAILVEGKYDKIRLSSLIQGNIIVCHGFRIFKNKEMLAMLRRLAQKDGLLVLTDSDRAGFAIRSYVKGSIPEGKVYHAYIPEVLGKERRKREPSKEGLLGVEGMETQAILRALERSGVLDDQRTEPRRQITLLDLYEDGLTGGPDSSRLRRELLSQCELPSRLSTKELVNTLNSLFTYEEYQERVKQLKQISQEKC